MSRSRLVITLEDIGVHHVFVSSFGQRETGDYTLWLSTVSSDAAEAAWPGLGN